MKHKMRNRLGRVVLLAMAMVIVTALSARLRADTGTCGGASVTLPFTDVLSSNIFFCSIAEAYFSALTNGTTATTYSPNDPVPREQMAAFITRTLDQSLRRGNRRAALNQWWTTQVLSSGAMTGLTPGLTANDVVSDGADLWTVQDQGYVNRVRASDGHRQDAFQKGCDPATTAVVAAGRIYVAGGGTLSFIQGTILFNVSTGFSPSLTCITFDGAYVWTGADSGAIGKTSIVDNTVITVGSGFGVLRGMLFDGSNVWVTKSGNPLGRLQRLDSNGGITLSIATGISPGRPIFDGTNIWVPNSASDTLTVIRASTGVVLATLNGNGLSGPTAAAFDGQRIMVINANGNSVSLWKAADLSPLGSINLSFDGNPLTPSGVCSDGINFWVTTNSELLRF